MPVTSAQYDFIANSLIAEINNNYEFYKQCYEKPMPFFIGVPEIVGDKINIIWDTSYTFDAQGISYSFELASDYTFANPIVKLTDLIIPTAEFDKLKAGQYFVRVIAHDAGGQTQTAFDSYMTEGGKVYGTKCFYVDADGKIVEDVYVED